MKKIFILMLCLPMIIFGQRPSGDFSGFNKKNNSSYFRGNVSGKITDLNNGKKLEFANISIVNTKWNKVIEGTISNEDGKFNFSGILIGDYILQIKYLGYKLKEVEFKLTKKNPDINLKEIGLGFKSRFNIIPNSASIAGFE